MSRQSPHKRRGSLSVRVALAAALAIGTVAGFNAATLAAPGVDQIDAQRAQIRALESEVAAIDARAAVAADAHASAQAQVVELRQAHPREHREPQDRAGEPPARRRSAWPSGW